MLGLSREALVALSESVKKNIADAEADSAQAALLEMVSNPENAKAPHSADVLQRTLEQCRLLQSDGNLLQALENFHALLIGGVVEAAISAEAKTASWDAHVKAADRAISTISEFQGFGDTDAKSRTWTTIMAVAGQAMDMKAVLSELQGHKADDETVEHGDLVGTALTAKEILADTLRKIVITDATPLHLKTVCGLAQEILDAPHLAEHQTAARKVLLANLAKIRAKLQKVGGGTDNGASWKADVRNVEAFADPAMTKALKGLDKAYIECCQRRVDATKMARRLPTRAGQDASPIVVVISFCQFASPNF